MKSKSKFPKRYRLQMTALMLFADLLGFGMTGALIYFLHRHLRFFVFGPSDVKYVLVVLLCLTLFMSSRLYPGIGINPTEEMRLVTQYVSISFLIGLLFFNIIQPGWMQNYFMLPPAWGLSLAMVLFSRWGVRILSIRLGVWGEPVVVISNRKKMDPLVRYFLERRRLGLVPVLGVSDSMKDQSSSPVNILDLDAFLHLPDEYFTQNDIHTALVGTRILSDLSELGRNQDLLRKFKRLIFISDMDWLEGASISLHDFEGMLGLEAEQNLLTPLDQVIKRAMDILFSILIGLVTLPIYILIGLAISLDSPGPVFYSQERLGKGGHKIKIYKFRTMVKNADGILDDFLQNHPDLCLEWEQTQKLRNDPRITRVGGWLRKFSLDELPQLYNVLRGEMSLVGPRPILESEAWHYQDKYEVYSTVNPGLTGFWQVSGRNHTSYDQRVMYDVYYVRNWSVWLDFYILIRTIWVVLSRDGAY